MSASVKPSASAAPAVPKRVRTTESAPVRWLHRVG